MEGDGGHEQKQKSEKTQMWAYFVVEIGHFIVLGAILYNSHMNGRALQASAIKKIVSKSRQSRNETNFADNEAEAIPYVGSANPSSRPRSCNQNSFKLGASSNEGPSTN